MARSRLSLSISGDAGAKSFRFKDGNFPALVIGMEHGNPVHVPDQFARESNPKGKPMREGRPSTRMPHQGQLTRRGAYTSVTGIPQTGR
jgi:hypothetical protein